MKIHALRLQPGQDLKESISKFCLDLQIKAGATLACVGSLSQAKIRLADSKTIKSFEENLEIVSLTGTISSNGCHLHISFADAEGKVFGGHLKSGCLIYTTAEIVATELDNVSFKREMDEATGYKELVIKTNNPP